MASLTVAFLFFIIQYFLINKGISVSCDIKKEKEKEVSSLFNDFGLKCLLRSTDMHEIDYTFLFFSFFSFSFLFPKVIWRGWGGCIGLTWSKPYI